MACQKRVAPGSRYVAIESTRLPQVSLTRGHEIVFVFSMIKSFLGCYLNLPKVLIYIHYGTPLLPKVSAISQAKRYECLGDGGSVSCISQIDDCAIEVMSCRRAGDPNALLPAQFGSQALAAKFRNRDPDCHFRGILQIGSARLNGSEQPHLFIDPSGRFPELHRRVFPPT